MTRFFALAALFVAFPAVAQPTIVGEWSGDIEVTTALSLTAVFHVSESDSGYVVTFDSPDQGAFGIPLSDVSFDGETFSASLAAASASFSGSFDSETNQIQGIWTQSGREMPLTLSPYEAPAASAASRSTKPADIKPGDYSGDWAGVIALGNGGEIHLTFHLARNEEGIYHAILDAPGQAENLNVGQIDVYGNEVVIEIMGQASFVGTVSDDETTMAGTFEQGGTKRPLTLMRQ